VAGSARGYGANQFTQLPYVTCATKAAFLGQENFNSPAATPHFFRRTHFAVLNTKPVPWFQPDRFRFAGDGVLDRRRPWRPVPCRPSRCCRDHLEIELEPNVSAVRALWKSRGVGSRTVVHPLWPLAICSKASRCSAVAFFTIEEKTHGAVPSCKALGQRAANPGPVRPTGHHRICRG